MCCLPPYGIRVVPSSTINLLGYEPNILAPANRINGPQLWDPPIIPVPAAVTPLCQPLLSRFAPPLRCSSSANHCCRSLSPSPLHQVNGQKHVCPSPLLTGITANAGKLSLSQSSWRCCSTNHHRLSPISAATASQSPAGNRRNNQHLRTLFPSSKAEASPSTNANTALYDIIIIIDHHHASAATLSPTRSA